ncbi:MAG TPA: alpha/beta hydrolase [Rhizomicrobium sp.]|jgi:pimeloyl-ACP methyl ester carboxylesterase
MPQIEANGITLEYESAGPANAETVLLIMGLGAQMIAWPQELIDALVAKGYRVVWYDNRDVGLSHKFDAAGPADIAAIMAAMASGQTPKSIYLLNDMAADAAGLLEALGIARAHIVGASMGGMIAQMVAANHPEKTLSLTSIMSTTGNRDLPPAKPEAMAVLMTPVADTFEGRVENAVKSQKIIGSPGYPVDEARLRENAIVSQKRMYYPAGFSRQMAAIMASGDRREALKSIKAPSTVLHGADDPLVPLEGGKDTASTIPGAELVVIPGMGHDLPLALVEQVANVIHKTAQRAKVAA